MENKVLPVEVIASHLAANIIDWVKEDLVEGVNVENDWYIDVKSLMDYLAIVKNLYTNQLQLNKKNKTIDEELSNTNSILLKLYTIRELTPLYKLWVQELVKQIPDSVNKAIFEELTSGKLLKAVAHTFSMPELKVCRIYKNLIKEFLLDGSVVISSKTTLEKQQLQIKQLQFHCKNLEKRLCILKNKYPEIDTETHSIPIDDLKILYKSLEYDFALDRRAINALHCAGMYTLEDLLRYTAIHGLNALLKFRGFGPKTVHHILWELGKAGIFANKDFSHLYKYLK